MWRDRILEAKKEKGISTKCMAEYAGMTEKTVSSILHGKTQEPYISTVITLGASVGLSPVEIFTETGLVVGNQDLAALQAEVDRLNSELDVVKAERDQLVADKIALSDKVSKLKDEIIDLHKYYIKRESKGVFYVD